MSAQVEEVGAPAQPAEPVSPPGPAAGGSRELIALALPLVVSQSFATVLVFIDTYLLAGHDSREMAATLPAMLWFWLGFGIFQATAGYTSTFVAQYIGAGRPHRVGLAVWQGVFFAVVAGLLFLVMIPLAPYLIAVGGHAESLQALEVTYLRYLAVAGVPMLIMAAVNGFFAGRGQTWTVFFIEAVGIAVNIALCLVLIFGRFGFPEMGIAGAGLAMVVGSWASAGVALALFLRKQYRAEFATLTGCRFESDLFRRLMKYGLPAGMQVLMDVIVFTAFVQLVGRLGEAETGATTLAVRLNMIAFLPMMGLGQAICILVGQRLGGDRPDLAERTAYTGLRLVFGYMCVVAAVYLLLPHTLVGLFEDVKEPARFQAMAGLVPNLLICVALYSLAEAVNVSFAFALRGAGDTRYVSLWTFALAWPIMVGPTAVVVWYGWSLYWAWAFATAYIFAMAVCFWLRFRTGKWKAMRVIEPEGVIL